MSDILTIGWVTLDFIGRVTALPTVETAAWVKDFDASCGGRAANQAMAVSAVEGSVALIARLGSDQHAAMLREELEDIGVSIDFVTDAPAATGMRMIAQEDDGPQLMMSYGGANLHLTVDDLNTRREAFANARAIGITAEPAGAVVLRAQELAGYYGKPVVLTHVSGQHVSDRVLAGCSVLIASTSACTGLLAPEVARQQPANAARALCQRGAPAACLLTSDHAYCAVGDEVQQIPSPGALDHEEAMDAFVAGVLMGLAEAEPVQRAVLRGVRVACLLVD